MGCSSLVYLVVVSLNLLVIFASAELVRNNVVLLIPPFSVKYGFWCDISMHVMKSEIRDHESKEKKSLGLGRLGQTLVWGRRKNSENYFRQYYQEISLIVDSPPLKTHCYQQFCAVNSRDKADTIVNVQLSG